jgi:hypothetical protein
MELLNRILAKTAVTNAQAIITDMTNRIESKDPNHEIIARNRVLCDDLHATRLFLMDTENEIRTLRNMLLISESKNIEYEREIANLQAKVKELMELI